MWCGAAVNEPSPFDVEMLQQQLLAERQQNAERLQARDQKIDRLTAIIKALQRHRFGRRAEPLDADQLALALEDVEQTVSAAEAAAEKSPSRPTKPARQRRINRGGLPAHLPREEVVLDVAEKHCACCGGLKACIGEDVSQRLDVVPAQFRVIVTRRPKYACRACQGEVVQVAAPERLVENGLPTEALVAQVLVAKYPTTCRSTARRRSGHVRQRRSTPILEALKPWLEHQLTLVSGKARIATAIRYALSRWEGLSRFLDDGRVELDSNVVERAIRPITLGRKNHLFAGSDGGAQHWAVLASLIAPCKLNHLDPYAYLADVLGKLVARHPMSRIDELLPFAYVKPNGQQRAAA